MPTDGDHNTIETFDPTANPNADGTPGVGAWTVGPDSLFTTQIGDTGVAMLSDGQILLGSYLGSQTLFYDYTRSPAPPGNSAPLSYRRAATSRAGSCCPTEPSSTTSSAPAEKYVPSATPGGIGSWINVTLPNTTPPIQLRDPVSDEIGGPRFCCRTARCSASAPPSQTAYYTPGVPARRTPATSSEDPTFRMVTTLQDGPATLLPGGKVLLVTSGTASAGTFREFDWRIRDTSTGLMGVFNTIAQPNMANVNPTPMRFLALPSGEILLTSGGEFSSGWVYTSDTPGDGASPDWRPQIYSILGGWTFNPPLADGVYRLSGTQLNGLSYGASYGDEGQSATNYPIIEFVSRTTGQTFSRARSITARWAWGRGTPWRRPTSLCRPIFRTR